jgi:hypothetical protein
MLSISRAIFSAALVFFASASKAQTDTRTPTPEQLQQSLQIAANILNKNLPFVVDRSVTLTSSVAEHDNSFTYHFEVNTVGVSLDFKQQQLKVTNSYCSAPDLAIMRQYDVPVNWDYYSTDGQYLQRITTRMADCNQTR